MSKLDEYYSVVQVTGTADNKKLARLSQTAKQQIKALVLELIGEDETQEFEPEYGFCDTCEFEPTDDTKHCICYYRNQLREEIRKSVGEL